MRGFITSVFVYGYSVGLRAVVLALMPLGLVARGVRRWDLPRRWIAARHVPEPGTGATIWLHASSLGECRLSCRFVAILREKEPSARFVLTAVTATGVEFLRTHASQTCTVAGYLPLDTPGRMRRFIRLYSVKRVWLMETELWPAMLYACARERVPVAIANARLEQRTMSRYRALGPVWPSLLGCVDRVLAQDDTYAARFRLLGVPERTIRICGNLKSRVDVVPMDRDVRASMRRRLGLAEDEPVVTAGCVHPGEGALVREAVELVRSGGTALRCIVVPRHREAAGAILKELGVEAVRVADTEADGDWTYCLIDKYGILEDMYGIADVAVVGGTFVKVGGHSMWEPARYAIPVIYGPVHHTQSESCERLRGAGVAFEEQDAAGVARRIEDLRGKGAAQFAVACDTFARTLASAHRDLVDMLP